MKRKIAVATIILMFISSSAYAEGLNQWAEDMIVLPKYDSAYESVSVALIDTGIDTSRLDNSRVGGGKSYISDTLSDKVGHGTRIASLIIGAENGNDAVMDLAPNAMLFPLVYYSQYPSGVPINGGTEAICRGIYDAVDEYNCRIISVSSGVTQPCAALEEAVAYAEKAGVIVVSAVGNEGGDKLYYPAAYPTVVGVGSVGLTGVSAFSQRNASVSVCAPGENLYAVSERNGTFFEQYSGTSYACAYVTACAARLLGRYPQMTPKQFRWLLQNTCADLETSGYDEKTGFGLLQIEAAMSLYPVLSVQQPLPYRDVYVKDQFYESILYVYQNGLMTGTAAEYFSPNDEITRAMAVTILYRDGNEAEAEAGAESEASVFADVSASAYYAEAVAWATENGIVRGYDNEAFAPDDPLTKKQLALILQRYAAYKQWDISASENNFAQEKFPDDIITRAEFAMKCNMLKKATDYFATLHK